MHLVVEEFRVMRIVIKASVNLIIRPELGKSTP